MDSSKASMQSSGPFLTTSGSTLVSLLILFVVTLSPPRNTHLKFLDINSSFKLQESVALTGVAQLVGHHPTKRKVAGSIPDSGTCLCCRFGPWWGHMQEATDQFFPHGDVSLPLFSLSKNK